LETAFKGQRSSPKKRLRVLAKIYIFGRIFPSATREMGQCRHAKNADQGKRLKAASRQASSVFSARSADATLGEGDARTSEK
jgi:hypothetical protein